MSTLKITKELLNGVKNILDNASWGYTFSNNEGKDIDKAISYLDSCSFSIKAIKEEVNFDIEALNERYEDELEELETLEDTCKMIASFVANGLGDSRIRNYNWSVDESVCFSIA